MNPDNGQLYPDLNAALRAGVENPVELRGRAEDIARISEAVAEQHKRETGSAKRRRKAIERREHWDKEN